MANKKELSPQGYNITEDPTNDNPFWEEEADVARANNQPLSPQGYNIQRDPTNHNPFWEDGGDVPAINHGIPPGGTTGEALVKLSDADYDVGWLWIEGGGGGGGVTPGQVQQMIDASLVAVNDEIYQINNTLTGHLGRITALENWRTTATAQITSIQDTVAGHTTAIATINETLGEVQSDIAELRGFNDDRVAEIANERAERIAADAELQTQIDNINTSGYDDTEVRQLIQDNTDQIDIVKADLTQETEQRILGDQALDDKIAAVKAIADGAVATADRAEEKADAAVAKADSVEGELNTFKTDQTAKDEAQDDKIAQLVTDLGAEVEARMNADAGLQGQITNNNASVTARLDIVEARADEAYEYGQEFIQWRPTVESRLTDLGDRITTTQDNIDTLASEFNGGTTGQVLTKASDNDRDMFWAAPAGGIQRETYSIIEDRTTDAIAPQFSAITVASMPTTAVTGEIIGTDNDFNLALAKQYDYLEISGRYSITQGVTRPGAITNVGYPFVFITPTYKWPEAPSINYNYQSMNITLMDGAQVYITPFINNVYFQICSSAQDPDRERTYTFLFSMRMVRYV